MMVKFLLLSLISSFLFSAGLDNSAPEHRQGTLLIEATICVIEYDQEADGSLYAYDAKGWYCGYGQPGEFWEGDKVLSIFAYNPLNNFADDILWRGDILLSEGIRGDI